MTQPLVTIGIPTYKRPEYLRGALSSALTQHYPHLEIVVSDNAHDPQTARVVAEFAHDPRVRYWPQPENLGMAGNWDALVEAAQGQYFLILSDDDLLLPETVGGLVGALERHPEAAFSFCSVRFIGPAGEAYGERRVRGGVYSGIEAIFAYLRDQDTPFLCGTLFDLDKLRAQPSFASSGYRLVPDAATWMRLALEHNAVCLAPETFAVYRIHEGSLSVDAGLEGWKREITGLSEEISALLVQHGYPASLVHRARALFDAWLARNIRDMIIRASRNTVLECVRAFDLLNQHRRHVLEHAGLSVYMNTALRAFIPSRLNDPIRRLKQAYLAHLAQVKGGR